MSYTEQTSATTKSLDRFISNIKELVPTIIGESLAVDEGEEAAVVYVDVIDSIVDTLTEQAKVDFKDIIDKQTEELKQLTSKYEHDLAKVKSSKPKLTKSKKSSSGTGRVGTYACLVKKITAINNGVDDGQLSAETVLCGDHFSNKTSNTYKQYNDLRSTLNLEGHEHSIGNLVETLKNTDDKFGNVVILTAAIWGLIDPDRRKELEPLILEN